MTINANYDFSNPREVAHFLEEITRIPAWREVGTRNNPGFENSWANFSGAYSVDTAFTIDQWNSVRIKGVVDTGASNSTVFILPEKYWPSETLFFPVVQQGGTLSYAYVTTAGEVKAVRTGTHVHLTGIAFRAGS